MAGGVEVLDLFMRHPTIWEDADAKEFCIKAFVITGNPTKYIRYKEELTVFDFEYLAKNIGSLLFTKVYQVCYP
jgi:hypothetical protein